MGDMKKALDKNTIESYNTFIGQYLLGHCELDDIDDWVEAWHTDPDIKVKLHEYLGMTEGEYGEWATGPDKLWSIVQTRFLR